MKRLIVIYKYKIALSQILISRVNFFFLLFPGGWAILQAPPQPGLVGRTLEVTCRVRGTPQLHEVILYKDGVEVMRQTGPNSQFSLTNLTMEHKGMYSCRASWDAKRHTHSVLSAETPVQVFGKFGCSFGSHMSKCFDTMGYMYFP